MPRILVIDDDTSVRNTITIVLQAKGFEVATAANGREGLAQIAAGQFDAVILDIFMPEMDGLEAIRCIREHSATLPIIAVSGGMSLFEYRDAPEAPAPDFLDMATKLGAITAVPKPFKPRDLVAALDTLMRKAA